MGVPTRFQAPLDAARTRWAGLSQLVRRLLIAVFVILAGLVLLWIFNQLVIFYLTRSYVEEVAEVFDINQHLARAIVWVSFAVMVFLVGYAISFSKQKRLIGSTGILLILIAHSIILWRGTSYQLFERSGKAIKCYVITRDAVRFGERPGTDPETGRECRPVTVEMAERLRAYERGERPRKIETATPTFFDLRTGEPIVWYYKHKSGQIDMFDLMGFHPDAGAELLPVTKEIVDLWKTQQARRPPQRVDPDKFEPFDSITGDARIWFRREENGDYAFYDRPGFDPGTGEQLSSVTREVIDSWRKQRVEASSKKCYIIARDPREPVRYGDRPGIDPATGRQCRELTPEMVERLQEYAKGNRPKRVEANDPTFFDLRTGEPLVWYYKNKSGTIEIFDLMGFHPETGDELVPITKEVVELWKSQRPQQARPPQRIDPDKYPFFDPRTGEPRVWYWRGGEGRYEFYDNQGFHPRTGEPLKVITREVIDKWKQETEAIEKKKKAEEERHQLELQERAEREEKEKRDQAAREERRRREAIEEQERQTKVGLLCDQLAANPNDPRRVTDGVAYDLLRSQAKDAVDACTKAVQQSPDELRYQYQLGRAMELINRQKAFEIQKRVASQQYPAAFDNLGWLYFTDQRNSGEAINQFLRGMQLNDPDSMVSLADMIDRHVYTPSNASDLKLSFLKRAADLGHQGAMRAYNIELEKIQAAQTQKLNEQEMQQRMFGIIDGFIQRIPRN